MQVDPRILPDVRRILGAYPVKVTAAYATSGHKPHGEHPKGLALDIVPDPAKGGTWADVNRLAAWAEPGQNQPRKPFRWVGYTGDEGHGPGHHLHLSWAQPTGLYLADPEAYRRATGEDPPTVDDIKKGPIGGGAFGTIAGAPADAAAAAGKATVNLLLDLLGENAGRIALYVALVTAGAVLAVAGASRALGVKPAKLAATIATRGAAK
jgi:hypothetical protein